MTIKRIAGFDHLQLMDGISLYNDVGLNYADFGMTYSGTNINYIRFGIRAANGRNWLAAYSTYTSAYPFYFYFHTNYIQHTPKTGKWNYGFRFHFNSPDTNTVYPALNVLNQSGTVLATTLTLGGGGTYFMEFQVDWDAKTVSVWATGSLIVNNITFGSSTDVVFHLGSPGSTPGFMTSTNDKWLGITDYYFAHTPSGETGGRLGPMKVKPATMNQAVSTPNWTTSDSTLTPTDIITTPLSLTTLHTPFLRSAPKGDAAVFNFNAPTESESIKFVQVDARMRCDDGMESKVLVTVADGVDQMIQTEIAPTTSLTVMTTKFVGGSETAPNGTAWTPADIAQLSISFKGVPVTP